MVIKRLLSQLGSNPMGCAARQLADDGVAYDVIRQMGRWNGDAMLNLPRPAIGTLAGFSDRPGTYHLKRACLDPPTKLSALVFPQVGYWETELKDDPSICSTTKGHWALLKWLRVVISQNAVLLKKIAPGHFIWKHDVFQTKLFKSF